MQSFTKHSILILIFLLLPICVFAKDSREAVKVPEWYTNIPQEGGFVTFVGQGEGENESKAKDNAYYDLNEKFLEKIGMTASGESSYKESFTNSGDDDDIYSETSYASSMAMSISAKTVHPDVLYVSAFIKDDGAYVCYVLGRMSVSEIEKYQEETKVYQKEEEQPYQIYKSLQTLFRQAGKEKEFMAEPPASYAKWLKEKCLVLENPLDAGKNSEWPGLFSDFLKKLFRNAICTNISVDDEPACVVYDRFYVERIKTALKKRGIKCTQDGGSLYIYAEDANSFKKFVRSMKNPDSIVLYIDERIQLDFDIDTKDVKDLLTKKFVEILSKKDRELVCNIRDCAYNEKDADLQDSRYAVVLEIDFSYDKKRSESGSKPLYNFNIKINAKFRDFSCSDSFSDLGNISKSYSVSFEKFKPKNPDTSFILAKIKDAINFLSQKDLYSIVEEFLRQI